MPAVWKRKTRRYYGLWGNDIYVRVYKLFGITIWMRWLDPD